MSFRFEHPDRPVEDNIRRAARDEFDRAIAELGESGFEVHETIRGVRRRLKRIRAVLKLVRPVFREYRNENARLRETGTEVAALRDAAALVEAADRLLARNRDGERGADLEHVRRTFAARAAALDAGLDRDRVLTGLRIRLRDARVRSELWEFDGGGRSAIVPGFVATYRAARRGLRVVKSDQREETFHEWRKAVKHHWIQLNLLRDLMPPVTEPRRTRAKKLAETLGDLQDLSVLRQALEDDAELNSCSSSIAPILATETAALCSKALKLGRPLFSQRPRAIEARWNAYVREWKAARRLI